MERVVIVRGIMLGVAAMLLVAALVALWVLFYSVAIAPGHDGAHYQAYGQSIAPLAAIIAGLPILFGAGWLAARGRQAMLAALIPALTYVMLDLGLSAVGNAWTPLALLGLSWLTKLLAAAGGGWLALQHQKRTTP
jgi:hypothetical protein